MSEAPTREAFLEVVWHDCECGGYDADLALWAELAARHADPVLDLGCGTGRVALDLAARGHDVVGVERDAALATALRERARQRGLRVEVHTHDVEELTIAGAFGLVLAPMQLLQMLPGQRARAETLRRIAACLRPGGALAAAIVEGRPAEALREDAGALPDVREHDGWVYSSLPLEVADAGDRLVVRRLRQVVAPDGGLSESVAEDVLFVLDAATLEREAHQFGLLPHDRIEVAATAAHVGSTVVVLRREEAA